jgi:hypothetical protein
MLGIHQANAVLVLALAFATAVAGFVAYRRRREAGRLLTHLIALVQTLLVAQVALGLLLLGQHRRADDHLHYLYGTLALLAVLAPPAVDEVPDGDQEEDLREDPDDRERDRNWLKRDDRDDDHGHDQKAADRRVHLREEVLHAVM